MEAWPHQARGIGEMAQLVASGCKRLAFTSPTGGGKSFCINKMLQWGLPSLVLCNRTMLFEQLGRGMAEQGVYFDSLASGYAHSNLEDVTLGMMQTTMKRWTSKQIELPPADIVFLDEAHNETGERSQRILKHYQDLGKTTVCVTATPIGIGHMADHLVIAGRNSELRKCGALVEAQLFSPEEPAPGAFKTSTKGIIQFRDECKEVMLRVVTGRILEYYYRLNPDQRPAILFAPGVAESKWITEQFMDAGIPWSHIDSKQIILNGEVLAANRVNRARLAEASKTGETKGVSNRFVMREGIDWPWLYYGILACTFGSLTAYIQAVGRLLRAHPSLADVIIADHGGNYWRHGSPNEDREWELDDTEKKLKEKREAAQGEGQIDEIVCPQCSMVRFSGAVCPGCGHAYKGSRRIIVQTDGSLTQVDGPRVKPPKQKNPHITADHEKWIKCYFQGKNSGMTFQQVYAMHCKRHGGRPPLDSPYMPKQHNDWLRRVADVPYSRLTRKSETSSAQIARLGA